MSLGLTFMPLDHDAPAFGYSHTMLPSHAGAWWHDRLKDLMVTQVPTTFNTFKSRTPVKGGYDDDHYGDTQRDPYGESLGCVTVAQILGVVTGTYPSRREIAIVHYFQMLDPTTRVALYWH